MLKEVMALYRLIFMQVLVNFAWTVLVVDTLMCQQELPFDALNLLHVYTVLRLKRESGTHLLKGKHHLQLRNPHQP